MIKRGFIGFVILIGVLSWFVCPAGAADTVKIGVITVLSGGQANNGIVDLRSAQMAARDYGTVLGKKVEVIARDHAYNAGIANEKAKELYEKENVDMIVACPNSGAALAVAEQALLHKKPFLGHLGRNHGSLRKTVQQVRHQVRL